MRTSCHSTGSYPRIQTTLVEQQRAAGITTGVCSWCDRNNAHVMKDIVPDDPRKSGHNFKEPMVLYTHLDCGALGTCITLSASAFMARWKPLLFHLDDTRGLLGSATLCAARSRSCVWTDMSICTCTWPPRQLLCLPFVALVDIFRSLQCICVIF